MLLDTLPQMIEEQEPEHNAIRLEVPDPAAPHWYEYPIGWRGEIVTMFLRTIKPLVLSVVLLLAVTFAVGFLLEDGKIDDLLGTLGYGDERISIIGEGLDHLLRMTMFPILVVGYFGSAGVLICRCLRDVAVSKALVAASGAGAPRNAVPPPAHVEAVLQSRFRWLTRFLVFTTCMWAFFTLVLGLPLAADLPGLALVLIIFTATHGWGWYMLVASVRPGQDNRRYELSKHWTTSDEQAAWDAARAVTDGPALPTPDGLKRRDRKVRTGRRLIAVALCFGAGAITLFQTTFYVMYPDADRLSNEPGPRADLPGMIERLVTGSLWTLAIISVFAPLLALIGHLLEAAGRSAERARLQEAVDDPMSGPPAAALRAKYWQRSPVRLAQVLTVIAGLALMVGISVICAGLLSDPFYGSGNEIFRPFRSSALITIIAGVCIIAGAIVWNGARAARGRPLRNALMKRWPAVPTRTLDDDGKDIPVRVGPALSLTERGNRSGKGDSRADPF